jgi:hypothetical protein
VSKPSQMSFFLFITIGFIFRENRIKNLFTLCLHTCACEGTAYIQQLPLVTIGLVEATIVHTHASSAVESRHVPIGNDR